MYRTVELLCTNVQENLKVENEYSTHPLFCENHIIRMKIKLKTLIS